MQDESKGQKYLDGHIAWIWTDAHAEQPDNEISQQRECNVHRGRQPNDSGTQIQDKSETDYEI